MDSRMLAKYIDQTLLKPFVSDETMRAFLEECRKYGFAMAAINSAPVSFAAKILQGSGVHVGAAISFPLGQTTLEVKCFETRSAIVEGADEIDYVINQTRLKSGDWAYIEHEMRSITEICHEQNRLCKVIFENCYLTDDEKKRLCEVAVRVRPDFIKTSTGFGAGGATLQDVRLMKSIVGNEIGVKAAGGIRTLEDALAFIQAGATRIGTSAGVKLLQEFQEKGNA